MYLEIAILLFEIVLLVFLSSPIWFDYKKGFPEEKDALVVRIVAEQFAWNIHYPGKDGKFGPTKSELMDGTNPIGLDREHPDGKDDIFTINNLHVPVNKPVIAHLTAKDVIHSFFIPVMRVKQDTIPGMVIPIHFQATQTGEYEIACAQLCGIGHYRMRGQFFVDTPEAFDKFLADEAASAGIADTRPIVNPAVNVGEPMFPETAASEGSPK
jgi:cytochrome c oxidase subunit 2